MRKLAAASVCALLAAAVSSPAFAQTSEGATMKLSQAECQALWEKADASQGGALSSAQARPYVTNFKAADSDGNMKLTSSEFLQACQKGHVQDSASTGAGSGSSGAGKQMPPE